ncbi:MAG: sensor histidine kinase [Thermoleophilia bacterium]|nr:sensor histidine kinase [Thermoleophilia bacterium]
MSLRARIAAASALALAVVATLIAVTIYSVVANELRGETEQQLRQIADRSTGRGGDRPRGGPGAGPAQPFGGARGYVQVVDEDGDVLQLGNDGDALPLTEDDLLIARRGGGEALRDDVEVNGTHLMVLTTGLTGGGALQVARPIDEVRAVLRQTATRLVIVVVLGVLGAIGLGLLVAQLALRPVARFTQEAEDIAADPSGHGRLDVTGTDEISRLAASFNATLTALEQSLDMQRQLIADAGHELRTPIASVRANIQVLGDADIDRLPPEDLAALRSDIVTELDELTDLLTAVIELARGSDPEAIHDDVRLDDVLRAAAERAERRGDSSVVVQLDLEPTVVTGDPARIARAAANIVDNARKWSPDGGTIEIELTDGVTRVRDHGPGFPEQELERVFDRFWRAESARSMPGSGLGLSIVQQTVAAHGGWVTATNAPDGGAIVTASFGPASAPAAGDAEDH